MKNDKKLKGFLQSGIIFVGDPLYMSGDKRNGPIEPDPHNPFKDWDQFTHEMTSEDYNLPLPGAFEIGATGRGCALQTGRLNGRYEVEKEVCPETGKVLSIKINFFD